jgi:hypothetical protein
MLHSHPPFQADSFKPSVGTKAVSTQILSQYTRAYRVVDDVTSMTYSYLQVWWIRGQALLACPSKKSAFAKWRAPYQRNNRCAIGRLCNDLSQFKMLPKGPFGQRGLFWFRSAMVMHVMRLNAQAEALLVVTGGQCSPRHQTDVEPSFLESMADHHVVSNIQPAQWPARHQTHFESSMIELNGIR